MRGAGSGPARLRGVVGLPRLLGALLRLGLAALLAAGLAGCAQPSGQPGTGPQRMQPSDRRIVVLAAASLTDAFSRIGREFEASSPGVRVEFGFGGSSALAEQVLSGAPADVLAAASPATMRPVTDTGHAADRPRIFARNRLTIAVPRGNPGRVTSLSDLSRPALKVALCAEQVPCGAAARTALAAAGVTAAPDTLEQDVRAVLAKVRLGEVDAGLVYRTDVLAAGEAVQAVDFHESGTAVNDYPVTALRGSASPEDARRFVDWLTGERGRAVLGEAGFELP